jgi:hypothetical protein
MAFQGRTAVVVGGSGTIGSGIIRVSSSAHAPEDTRCTHAIGGGRARIPHQDVFLLLQTLLKHGAAVLAPVRSAKAKASLEKDVAGVSADKLQVMLCPSGELKSPFCVRAGGVVLANMCLTKYYSRACCQVYASPQQLVHHCWE